MSSLMAKMAIRHGGYGRVCAAALPLAKAPFHRHYGNYGNYGRVV